jgi:hypothetical protein
MCRATLTAAQLEAYFRAFLVKILVADSHLTPLPPGTCHDAAVALARTGPVYSQPGLSDATFSILVHVKETGVQEATPDVVGQGAARVGRLLGVPLFFLILGGADMRERR